MHRLQVLTERYIAEGLTPAARGHAPRRNYELIHARIGERVKQRRDLVPGWREGFFARDRAINSRALAAFEKALAKPPKSEHHSVSYAGDRSEVRNLLHDHVDPGVFAPDAVRTLIAAFDGAWQSIIASGARLSGQQRELTRELLAKYIIEKAQQGELDECRLRDGALRRLAQSNLRYPPPAQK